MRVTKKRTFVKTAIYRVWILITSYIFLSIVGKSWSDSILPTLTLNFLYSIGYYTYDRIWQNIKWGIKKYLMNWIIFKYLLTAGMVVLISEIAKRSDRLGGLIAALPLVTVLTLSWLYIENQSSEKIANHAYYTFWYVLPTLPMFLIFPYLLKKYGFWITLSLSMIITLVIFYIFAKAIKLFGINLL